jgi:hypothetical protein
METIFLASAIVGGTLLVGQFLLSLLGIGHHDVGGHDFHLDTHDLGGHDAAHDTGHEAAAWFARMLTFRAVVAAATFFGLAGMAGTERWGAEAPITLCVALAAGVAALFLVATLLRGLDKLHAEGNVRIDRAVGKGGTVYLTIPGAKTGMGKVHLNLQNRTMEYQAVTAQQALPTGTKIVVVSVINSDTVEVAPATQGETIHHA